MTTTGAPTDTDLQHAIQALGPTYTGATATRVATALANERARARQPFLDLADQLDADTASRRRISGATPCCDAADRIRQAAQDTVPPHVHGAWCHPSADGCPDNIR